MCITQYVYKKHVSTDDENIAHPFWHVCWIVAILVCATDQT